MNIAEIDAITTELAVVMKEAIAAAVAPLRAQNEALETRSAALTARLEALESKDVAAELRPMIDAMSASVAALPAPKSYDADIEALRAEIPPAADLSGLATKAELEAVRDAIPGEADLSGLATKDALAEAIASIPAPEPVDLSGLATKSDVQAIQAAIPAAPDLSAFATKDDLAEVVRAIPELPEMPQLTEVDLTGLATKADVDAVREAIPAAPDLTEFATKAEVTEALAAIPVPVTPDLTGLATKADVDAVREAIPAAPDLTEFATKAEVTEALAAIPVPVTPDLTGFATKADVDAVREAIPAAVEPKDFGPEIEDVRRRVEAIKMPEVVHGKDGRGVASARKNDDGELILKLTDGETINVGVVVGRDGFSLDDFNVEDGEREFTLIFSKGEVDERHAIAKPGFWDRGVWREGETYKAGDATTWGGSVWLAQRETTAKPDVSDDWRLAVKRGRDGKDLRPADEKPKGPVKV